MATTASASPMAGTGSSNGLYHPSNTPPQPDLSASQSVASTSSVTLDEPNNETQSKSNTATPGPSQEVKADGISPIVDEEDEDAKLLASLAENISKGMPQDASHAEPDDTAISSIKAEDFNALLIGNDADRTFTQTAEDTSGPIQAYAKLEFPGFSYYIQTLDCTIGRRPAHMRTPSLRDGETQHITGAKKMEGDVDVDLGLLKSISRLHVRIFYQEQPRQGSLPDIYAGRDFDAEGGQGTQGRFVLQVLGRNGCFVDDVPAEKDSIVPLGKRTKIQIAERVFYFVLPPVHLPKVYNSDGELGSGGSSDESEEESGSLGSSDDEEEESSGSSSSEEEESEEEDGSDDVKEAEMKKRPKLVLKKKAVVSATGGKGKGKGKQQGKTIWAGKGLPLGKRKKEDEEEEEEEEDDSEEEEEDDDEEDVKGKKATGKGSSKKVKASVSTTEKAKEAPAGETGGRKRKRGVEQGQSTPLKVGTPIGVETLTKSKKKKKVNGDGADTAKEALDVPPKGKGKGGGKAHIVAAALAAKAKLDEAKGLAPSSVSVPSPNAAIRPMAVRPNGQVPGPMSTSARPVDMSRPMQSNVRPASQPLHYQTSIRPAGVGQVQRPMVGVQQMVRPASNAPFPPSSAPFAHLAGQSRPPPATSSQPLPPAGPGIKPDLSNIDLVRDALNSPLSLNRGGKLTLQEIYEDISGKYEWYRTNNRTNGRDWHSAIRHAIGNSKEMIRIPKQAGQQGKGVYYALLSSEAGKGYRSEEQNNGMLSGQSGIPASPTPPIVTAPGPAAPMTYAPRPSPAVPAAYRPAPVPQSTAPTRPSPQIQPNTRVTIVIGKAPAEALAQMAAVPKTAMTRNIEALFKGPPIVHHEGKLYLNPVVFGHMSASEVNDIGGKGAQQALALLQAQLLKHLQSVIPAKAAAGQSASPQPARPPTTGAAGSASSPRPPLPANGTNPSSAPRPPVNMNRPMQARPGVPPPQGYNQSPRPGPPMNSSGLQGRPPPPGAIRPMSNGVPSQPMMRPGSAPVSARPQMMPQSRPPVTANGQAMAQRPMMQSAARPPAPLAPGQQQVYPRPGPPNASTPAGQIPPQRPLQSMPRPAQSIPRPPQSQVAIPSSSSPRPSSTSSAAPASSAVMAAVNAGDAAVLMQLISGGKVESGTKMTPGQLELLRRAGKIAAEKQKAQEQQQQQQQQKSASVSSSPSASASSSK
jgi:hypothetical protein